MAYQGEYFVERYGEKAAEATPPVAGDLANLDEGVLPPAMPDWSPVRSFGGYATWADPSGTGQPAHRGKLAYCGCAKACNIHGHQHAVA